MQIQIIIKKFLRSEKSHSYKLSAYDRILMIMLASYMGKNATCWPSIKSLIKDCGMSKDTIIRSLRKLHKLGILKITRKKNKNNVYEFYPQVVAISDLKVAISDHMVSDSYPNNNINNINNNKSTFDTKNVQTNKWKGGLPKDGKLKGETKSIVKFWEPGNPDYDRVNTNH